MRSLQLVSVSLYTYFLWAEGSSRLRATNAPRAIAWPVMHGNAQVIKSAAAVADQMCTAMAGRARLPTHSRILLIALT